MALSMLKTEDRVTVRGHDETYLGSSEQLFCALAAEILIRNGLAQPEYVSSVLSFASSLSLRQKMNTLPCYVY